MVRAAKQYESAIAMKKPINLVLVILVLGSLSVFADGRNAAQSPCRTFIETGKTVCGRFLEYWQQNGQLPQQGFPISDELLEVSPTDGRTYSMQYFERAVFEYHPENQAPYDMLLSLLGTFEYKRRYSTVGAPDQKASTNNPRYFNETSKTLDGKFREYWEMNGGLAQQGYPISDEFWERSRLDGKVYRVQYFERAVFEYHPGNQSPYDVLLSLLGKFRLDWKNYKQSDTYCNTIWASKGLLISKGSNTVPTDATKLLTYQLEEVLLSGPVTCTVAMGRPDNSGFMLETRTLDIFWRLTITASERIHFGSSSYWVWLDDKLIGPGGTPPGSDHTQLIALVYDRSLLREGAAIGAGYDGYKSDVLPEKLHISVTP